MILVFTLMCMDKAGQMCPCTCCTSIDDYTGNTVFRSLPRKFLQLYWFNIDLATFTIESVTRANVDFASIQFNCNLSNDLYLIIQNDM